LHICRGDMLVLGLRPGAVPGWIINLHKENQMSADVRHPLGFQKAKRQKPSHQTHKTHYSSANPRVRKSTCMEPGTLSSQANLTNLLSASSSVLAPP
jgi:hypothetical protein